MHIQERVVSEVGRQSWEQSPLLTLQGLVPSRSGEGRGGQSRKVRRLHGRLRYRLGLLGDRVATGFTLGLSGSHQPNPTPGLLSSQALDLLVRLRAYRTPQWR